MNNQMSLLARDGLGEAAFSVSARVAIQLGRESISNSVVAVLELVKNAYDADADNVWVRFINLDSDKAAMIIEDDGIGMTKTQLVDNWMVIGTDNKVQLQKSGRKRRILVGEKGLGRLGLDRLSHSCTLQSFVDSEESGVELQIDWRRYETSGTRLESIYHKLYRIPKIERDPATGTDLARRSGVRLVLENLKDPWPHEDVLRLRRELSLLVSPFKGINDFTIWLETGGKWPDSDGRIGSEEMLEAAEWQVISTLSTRDGRGHVEHRMRNPQTGAEFDYSESWTNTFRDAKDPISACGPLEFVLYFLPREDMPRTETGGPGLSRAQIDTFMAANQGIRIYRDGFRVKPYGEPSGAGDWLNLSFRRQQSPQGVRQHPIGGWRVGYNQVVGAVFITREQNGALLDQTNREGIVEGAPYYDLRRFALNAVEFFEKSRQRYEMARSKPSRFEEARDEAAASAQASSQAVEDLKGTIDSLVDTLQEPVEIGGVIPGPEIVQGLLQAVKKVAKAVNTTQEAQLRLTKASEERMSEFQRQKDTLSNLASLGILAATFGHETQGASNLVLNNTELLKDNLGHLLFVEPEIMASLAENMENIEYGARKIETFAQFILKNVRRDKRLRVKVRINEVADAVLASFSGVLERDRGIKIIREYQDSLPPILAFRIDWESILINLLTNSVWALEDTSRDKRQIRIRIRENEGQLCLSFADSGCGLEAGTKELIFLPTFSTKRNRQGDVVGTGMGLAIVQNFVQSFTGTISVESPSDLGGVEFHIRVPLPQEYRQEQA